MGVVSRKWQCTLSSQVSAHCRSVFVCPDSSHSVRWQDRLRGAAACRWLNLFHLTRVHQRRKRRCTMKTPPLCRSPAMEVSRICSPRNDWEDTACKSKLASDAAWWSTGGSAAAPGSCPRALAARGEKPRVLRLTHRHCHRFSPTRLFVKLNLRGFWLSTHFLKWKKRENMETSSLLIKCPKLLADFVILMFI